MTYAEVVAAFEAAGYEVAQVHSDQGCLACIAAGARVIAFAAAPEEINYLFNPPSVLDRKLLRENLYLSGGAPGGDRLWIAPENLYFCRIDLAEYVDHSNNFIPPAIDPGAYSMELVGQRVHFNGEISVLNNRTSTTSEMRVGRSIELLRNPLQENVPIGLSSCSYQITQTLKVHSGLAGLWNIAQLPIGSVIVFPLRAKQQPTNYFNPSTVALSSNACAFYITGDSQTKIGYGSGYSTGKAAAFYTHEGQMHMLVREFSVVKDGFYCDLPFLGAPTDQVMQAWDGMGFGEMEYHSTAALGGSHLSSVQDQSIMHAVSGPAEKLLSFAGDLLKLPQSELASLIQPA